MLYIYPRENMRTRFRLKELLDKAGWTQTDLHRKSGVSYTTINRMCANLTTQVSLQTLDALSAGLGCEPGDLIIRDPKWRPPKR